MQELINLFLFQITKSKETAVQPLLQLSGRLQLVLAQVSDLTFFRQFFSYVSIYIYIFFEKLMLGCIVFHI